MNWCFTSFMVLNGHLGRDKVGKMLAARWYVSHIFRYVAEYCHVCQHVNTYKLQIGNETIYPIPVPLKVRSQIDIILIGLLKEIDGCGCIVIHVDYTNKFVGAEPLKEKKLRRLQLKSYTNYLVNMFLVTFKLQTNRGSW